MRPAIASNQLQGKQGSQKLFSHSQIAGSPTQGKLIGRVQQRGAVNSIEQLCSFAIDHEFAFHFERDREPLHARYVHVIISWKNTFCTLLSHPAHV